MKIVILKGQMYARTDEGLYIPITFTAVSGGAIMQQGAPLTLAQIIGSDRWAGSKCDATASKGAALLKSWDEEVDHD